MTRAPRRLTFSVTVVSLGTGSSESEISAGNICAIRRSDRRLGMGSATTPRRRPEGAGWPHELPHYTCRPDNAENQSGVDTILESLNTSVCGYGSHNLPPFFMDGSTTTNPSVPADWWSHRGRPLFLTMRSITWSAWNSTARIFSRQLGYFSDCRLFTIDIHSFLGNVRRAFLRGSGHLLPC